MNKDTFKAILSYCDRKQMPQAQKDVFVRKFIEALISAIEDKENQKGSKLREQELKDIEQALLTEVNLDTSLVAAESYYTKLEDSFYLQFKKNNRNQNFLSSIALNVVSNIIYSGLLIILFIIAKDQIKIWLDSLMN